MEKFNAQKIKRASNALRESEEIAQTVGSLLISDAGAQKQLLEKVGSHLRSSIGANTLTQFTQLQLGDIAVTAIITALIKKRRELEEEHDFVEFPSNPSSWQGFCDRKVSK